MMETDERITEAQAEALRIVRNLLQKDIDPQRIMYGQAKCYFPILLDGKNQKPICRLYFNSKIYIGTISERKVETKVSIKSLDEIQKFSREMRTILKKYIG